MKQFDELISELTPEDIAELLATYKPSKKERYKQALQAATVEPSDSNITTVLLLKARIKL